MSSDEREWARWPAAEEYFRTFTDGRFDESSQLWLIVPRSEVRIGHGGIAIVVGSPGCDGIEFCLRRASPGVWAFYPIDEEWVLVADSLAALEAGWRDGSVTV